MGAQLQGNRSGDCSPRHFVYFYHRRGYVRTVAVTLTNPHVA
jgi:hypothetical protein